MIPNNQSNKANAFASRPMQAGKAAVLIGLAAIAFTSFFVPDQGAKEFARIAGGALILVGGFAYGFGRLISATNESPRSNAS